MTTARGNKAWGECGRCGSRVLLRNMISDGYIDNLIVCRSCYEPPDYSESLQPLDDPVSVDRPAPSNNRVGVEITFPNYDVVNDVVNDAVTLSFNFGCPEPIMNAMTEAIWIDSGNDWLEDSGGNKLVFNG